MEQVRHLGVIMDGNRRWARANAFDLIQGHNKGADKFGHLCEWCLQAGIPYLTVYAFSTENWKRTDKEINHLFSIMEKHFLLEKSRCVEKDIKIMIIGERGRFTPHILGIISDMENATVNCKKLIVQIALSYGGRDEIVRAAKKFAQDAKAGKIDVDEFTEDVFELYLDTANIPDVDLVIRTGGSENRRLSNFLPWQSVYSELFFSDLLWPEFDEDEFKRALEYFASVKRRLGK